jgi:hypothetical protein
MFGLRKKIGRIIEGENSNCVTSSCGNSTSKIVLAHVAY